MKVTEASFVAEARTLAQLPPPAFAEVAFGGRSNVGKSSLLNTMLARRRLVRTSGTPGCTRGLNLFRATLLDPEDNEAVIDLVDLPGYGFAERSKHERRAWGPLIETFLEKRAGLCAVVLIVDVRRGVEEDDQALLDYLDSVKRKSVLVATKLDKLPTSKRKLELAKVRKLAGRPVIGFSAETGEGRDALWRVLLDAAAILPATTPRAAAGTATARAPRRTT